MAQLKIIFPLNSDPQSNREITDRPNIVTGEKCVRSVPGFLQPYVPLEHWIEFCDEIAIVYTKGGIRICSHWCLFASGLFLLVAGTVVLNNYVFEEDTWGALMLGLGFMMVVGTFVFYCANERKWKMIHNACRDLSDRLLATKICYRVLKKPPRGRGLFQTRTVHHRLEVIVTNVDRDHQIIDVGREPYYKAKTVKPSTAIREDDHYEILGGTGTETLRGFAAAHHASTGAANARASLYEQMDAMDDALGDDVEDRCGDGTSTDPETAISDPVEAQSARLAYLESIRGTLTKAQYEASLKAIFESV